MDLTLIEDFILGRLNAEEERTVQERIENDTAFAEEYQLQKLLFETVKRSQTREIIKDIHHKKMEQWEAEKVVPFNPKQYWSGVFYKVASMAAAACIMAVLYLGNADFEKPNIPNLTERGNSDMDNANLEVFEKYISAQHQLNNRNYTAAAREFEKLKNDTELRAYYQDASQWFEIVATSENDKNGAKVLLAEMEKDSNLAYPVSWIELWKMKIRLLFS
jgi:hypothetical protein